MSHLSRTVEHGLATITLDRSPQNRIDDQMVDELATAFIASPNAQDALVPWNGR